MSICVCLCVFVCSGRRRCILYHHIRWGMYMLIYANTYTRTRTTTLSFFHFLFRPLVLFLFCPLSIHSYGRYIHISINYNHCQNCKLNFIRKLAFGLDISLRSGLNSRNQADFWLAYWIGPLSVGFLHFWGLLSIVCPDRKDLWKYVHYEGEKRIMIQKTHWSQQKKKVERKVNGDGGKEQKK